MLRKEGERVQQGEGKEKQIFFFTRKMYKSNNKTKNYSTIVKFLLKSKL